MWEQVLREGIKKPRWKEKRVGEKDVSTDWSSCLQPELLKPCPLGKTKCYKYEITASRKSAVLVLGCNFASGNQ